MNIWTKLKLFVCVCVCVSSWKKMNFTDEQSSNIFMLHLYKKKKTKHLSKNK